MNNVLASFVGTNRRYTYADSENIVAKTNTNVTLWQEDYEFIQLFLSSPIECSIDIAVECGDGISVELFSLDTTKAFVGHAGWYARNPKGIMPTGPKVDVDDILTPINGKNIALSEYKCVFAKINSSDIAGTADVKFNIKVDMTDEITLVADVDVLPIKMPKSSDYSFKVEYWQHPFNVAEYYNVEPWSTEHLDILREQQLFYKQLGGSGVTCTLLDEVWGGQTYSANEIRYPSMIKWIYSHGKWSFDYTDFDKWVELNIEIGLEDKFICYSMMPWNNKMRYYNADKNRFVERIVPTVFPWMYKKAWRVFLNDFVKHLDDKNWFEKIYIGFDERNNMKMILDFLARFTNKDGKHFKVAASFNNYLGNRKCLDMIDSVSVGIDEIKEHAEDYKIIAAERAREGRTTTLYTATEHYPNSFALSIPAESYYSIMYAYATGNNGFLRWAFDAWVENPLEDTTHWSFQAGDCFLVYPNNATRKPSWSFRLMKLDEAVRDVNKLNILRAKCKLAGEITKIVQKTEKNYTYIDSYDSSWGVAIRHAKWADNKAKDEIISDVTEIKDEIVTLFREYANKIAE